MLRFYHASVFVPLYQFARGLLPPPHQGALSKLKVLAGVILFLFFQAPPQAGCCSSVAGSKRGRTSDGQVLRDRVKEVSSTHCSLNLVFCPSFSLASAGMILIHITDLILMIFSVRLAPSLSPNTPPLSSNSFLQLEEKADHGSPPPWAFFRFCIPLHFFLASGFWVN